MRFGFGFLCFGVLRFSSHFARATSRAAPIMMTVMKLCLAALACAATVSAWDLEGDNGWKHEDTNGVQLTQVQALICEGKFEGETQTPIAGCDDKQDKSATRTWSGYWDYITIGGGYVRRAARAALRRLAPLGFGGGIWAGTPRTLHTALHIYKWPFPTARA